MQNQTFSPVSAQRWQDIKQVVHSDYGLTVASDEGSTESHGIQFSWLWASNTLTATVAVPHFGWALKMAGFHCEEDVMNAFTGKIDGVK